MSRLLTVWLLQRRFKIHKWYPHTGKILSFWKTNKHRGVHYRAGINQWWCKIRLGRTAGQQRGTENSQNLLKLDFSKARSHHFEGVWVLFVYFDAILVDVYHKKKLSKHVSSKCAQRTWKHTLKMVSNEKKENTKNDQPKMSSWSHSLFFLIYLFILVLFSIVIMQTQILRYNSLKTVNSHGYFSGQRPPCCFPCSALWEMWFRYQKHQLFLGQNQRNCEAFSNKKKLLLYIVFMWSSLGTFACCPAPKTSTHLYIVLFLMFVRKVCVFGGYVCVYLTNFIRENSSGKRRKWRPLISSRSMQWIWMWKVEGKRGKSYTIISFLLCFGIPCRDNKSLYVKCMFIWYYMRYKLKLICSNEWISLLLPNWKP